MKRSQWVLVIAFILVIGLILAYVVGSSTTEQRRVAARAALDQRVEKANAEVAVRHEALQAERNASSVPLTSAEADALNESIETAQNSGWNELTDEISKTEGPWPPELLAKVKAWLEANQGLLAQARALADRGADVDSARYSVDALQGAISTSGNLGRVARLLVVAADAQAADGHVDEAVSLLLDAASIADFTGAAPLLIAQMMRTATYGAALESVEQLLAGHDLSAAHLDGLERALEHAQQRSQFAAATANEANLGVTAFDDLRDGRFGFALRPIINLNETSYIEGMTGVAEIAGQPYFEGALRGEELSQAREDLPYTQYISRMLLRNVQPAIIRMMEDQARHEARVDMGRIAIALEREYQAAGAYPDSLDGIAQYFGGAVPVDPFTGQSFQYRVEGSAFVLYSVGSDLTDDAGMEDRRDGDIVWGGGGAAQGR